MSFGAVNVTDVMPVAVAGVILNETVPGCEAPAAMNVNNCPGVPLANVPDWNKGSDESPRLTKANPVGITFVVDAMEVAPPLAVPTLNMLALHWMLYNEPSDVAIAFTPDPQPRLISVAVPIIVPFNLTPTDAKETEQ